MKKDKNILCVFLSDLKSKQGDGVYYYRGENSADRTPIEGVHTNEPIAKYLIKTLGKRNEKLDKIIMICSQKVQMSFRDLLLDEEKKEAPNAGIINGLKKENEHFGAVMKKFDSDCNEDDISALRYYELAILDFMKKEYPELYYKEAALTVNALRENNHDLFQVLSVSNMPDEMETYRYLSELVRTFDVSQANLYIDLNGGFRDAAFILLAVSRIMKQKNINIGGCYHIDFDSKCTKDNPMIIKDKRYLFDTFDLISGTDEFFQYGSASKLSSFFKKDILDQVGSAKEREYTQNIQEYMNAISENLSVCCIEGMWNSLKGLKKALNDAKIYYEAYQGKGSKYQLFFWLIDNIEKEYGELLNKEDVKDYIGLIKWCIKKKMLQQALTFYEDTIPIVIVEKGILYYDSQQVSKKNIRDSTRFHQDFPQYTFWNNTYKVYGLALARKEREGWIKSNGAELERIRDEWKNEDFSEDYFAREKDKFDFLKTYLDGIEYENLKQIFMDESSYCELLAEEKAKRILEEKELSNNLPSASFIDGSIICTKLREESVGKIVDLQNQYAYIKKIRNDANHGKNGVDSKQIVESLNDSLSTLEQVIREIE